MTSSMYLEILFLNNFKQLFDFMNMATLLMNILPREKSLKINYIFNLSYKINYLVFEDTLIQTFEVCQ